MKEFVIDYSATWDYSQPYCVRVVDYKDVQIRADLIGGNEIVAESPEIEIVFDYPLSHEVTLPFSNDGKPFTRRDFWRAVYEGYTQIYREEDEAERQDFDGPYGIWGHDIGDLHIEGVTEVESNKFELHMGS